MSMSRKILSVVVIIIVISACSKDPIIDESGKPIEPDKPITDEKHEYPNPVEEISYAFPGAYGGGMLTTGGRGGKVIKVTSLEDNGQPGTLRCAINQQGARIVIFETSGTIYLKSKLEIKNDDITIAGQSASRGGITLAGYPVEVKASNVIIRYMRFRMGDEEGVLVGADGADALGGRNQKNIIIDHCSVSWSTDECSSFYDNKNFTVQWCILSESLRLSGHTKGAHGYGGIWGGVQASFLYNLLIHHDSRTPRFCGSRYSGYSENEKVDFRNNVLYNWGANNVYGAEGGYYNIVGNYYKPGPDSQNRNRLIQLYADGGENNQPKGTYGKVYVQNNYVEGNSNVTNNNQKGINIHSSFSNNAPGVGLNDVILNSEIKIGEVKTYTPTEAYEKVLNFAGSSLNRDEIDVRLVNEAREDNPVFTGLSPLNVSPYPKKGIIDSQNDLKPNNASGEWSPWPVLSSYDAPKDTDNDGMPDEWEIKKGLDPNVDDANGRHLSTAYDNIEVFLNELIENQNRKSIIK